MDVFLQHFSNIFVLTPPARTFQECIDYIKKLNYILQTPYLTAFEFVDFNDVQPSFQKVNFPGVKALTRQQLEQLFREFTDQRIKFDQDYDFLHRQTVYILQYLFYVNKRITANIEPQQIPYLLHKAWLYRIKIDYECVKEQVDQSMDITQTISELSELWFEYEITDIDTFINNIERVFKQTQSALIPIYGDFNLYTNLNHLLSQSQLNPITVPADDSTVIGIESQMSLEQNTRIAQVCQRNLSYSQDYTYYLNSMYVVQQIGEQLFQIKEQPAQSTLKQLIAQLYINQVNNQMNPNKQQIFSLTIFLLTGVTYLYNEQEFYLNLTRNLAALNDLIQRIFVFPPDIDQCVQDQKDGKVTRKRRGLFSGCGGSNTIVLNTDDVLLNMKRLSYILSQYCADNRSYELTTEIIIQDQDLQQFLNQFNGLEILFLMSLKLYNQLSQLFINKRLLSIIEGLYLLTKSALYGGVQSTIIQFINGGLMGTKLDTIQDFLQIVGAKIEVQTLQQGLQYEDLGMSQSEQQLQGSQQDKTKSLIPSVHDIDEMLDSKDKIEI